MATFASPMKQNFSLPSNIIYYMNHSKEYPIALQALQKTCKYFFAENAVMFIKNGNLDDFPTPGGRNNSIADIIRTKPSYWFLGSLKLAYYLSSRKKHKNISSKVYSIDVTSLFIELSFMRFYEFQTLVASDSLKEVKLEKCAIVDDDEKDIELLEILQKLPNCQRFCYHKTSQNLPELITKQKLEAFTQTFGAKKLEYFEISNFALAKEIDAKAFCLFLKNVSAPRAVFKFYFLYNCDGQKQNIWKAISKMKWNNPQQKPKICLLNYVE